MVTKNLMELDIQGDAIMTEIRKYATLFDKAFRKSIYHEYKGGEVITFEELKTVKKNTRLDLPALEKGDEIYGFRRDSKEDEIIYKSFFTNGATLPRHKHDCVEECTPIDGSFEVIIGREEDGDEEVFTLYPGETFAIQPYLPHQFTSLIQGKNEVHLRYIKP